LLTIELTEAQALGLLQFVRLMPEQEASENVRGGYPKGIGFWSSHLKEASVAHVRDYASLP